jgi:type I restriction enzyme M protein
LQKKTDADMIREATQHRMQDYEIFMAQVRAIGHDKRGNPLYKRNEEGEELLFEPEGKTTILEQTSSGHATARPLPRRKIPDDDTPIVASEFLKWKEQVVLGW